MKHLAFVILLLGCSASRQSVQLNTSSPKPSVKIESEQPPMFKEASTPCWDVSNKPCFVVDVSVPERIVAQWRMMSFYGRDYFVVDPEKDPIATVKEAYGWLPESEDPDPAKQGTVLFGPGSSEAHIERAGRWLQEAGMEQVQTTAEGFLGPEDLEKAREMDEVELSMIPETETDYLAEFKRHELTMRACFLVARGDQGPITCRFDVNGDGLVMNVDFSSPLPDPVPTKPPCSEYEEWEGGCEREHLVYPEEYFDDEVLDCLDNAIRGARFSPAKARDGLELNLSGPEPPEEEYDEMEWQHEN